MLEPLALINRWFPWGLVVAGVLSLLCSTVFYEQYLAVQKRIASSSPEIRARLDAIKPDSRRKIINAVLSLVMIAAGAVWLWING